MCRMFAYVGSSQDDLRRLYSALVEAASYDRNLSWLPDKEDRRHSDGWGSVVLSNGRIQHYRTHVPIFEDKGYGLPEIQGKTYAIFHARKANKGRPVDSPVFSHPFVDESGSRTTFLAHNGALKGPIPKDRVDSELALTEIVESDGVTEAFGSLKGRTKTALNLLVLTIDRPSRTPKLEYLNYWADAVSRERREYYRLYAKRMRGGTAVFSSSLDGGIKGGSPCRFGKVARLD